MGIMQPENPLVGGTVLRRAAIQSPNFVSGSAGWTVKQDGSAEFNNITIRNGTIISGVALYYSSLPVALGKLVASVSAAAGTDSAGNAYLAGVASYNPNALGVNFAVSVSSNSLNYWTGPVNSNGAGPWTLAASFAITGAGPVLNLTTPASGLSVAGGLTALGNGLSVTAGLTTLLAGLQVSGGATDQVTLKSGQNASILSVTNTQSAPTSAIEQLIANAAGDRTLAIGVAGEANNRVRFDSDTAYRTGPGGATALDTIMQRQGVAVWGPGAANGIGYTAGAAPAAVAGTPLLYGSTANRVRELSPVSHDTILSGTQTNVTTTTVTAAAFTALTNLFNIPANELAAFSVVEVDAEGFGTWGSTQQTLLFGADRDSALYGQSSTILATAFAASAGINWEAKVRLRVLTAGAGGTAAVMVAVTVSPTAGSRTVGDAVRLVRTATTVAFDTTVSHTIGLGCQWGSVTGAPTITSNGSTYHRLGS